METIHRPETILIDPAYPGRSGTTSRTLDEVTAEEAEAILAQARFLAVLMDSCLEIPGTKVKLGLDALIGFIPGIGDLLTTTVSGYIMLLAKRCGVSKWTMGKMIANTLVDLGVGIIPLVGDAFDVAWKANRKNVALLEQHLHKKFPHLRRPADQK
ncbi:MAG: DUF4112 domain-containing protein [Planctomycetales bacterium]